MKKSVQLIALVAVALLSSCSGGEKVKDFVLKGISSNLDERYHSVAEMQQAFEVAFPMSGY